MRSNKICIAAMVAAWLAAPPRPTLADEPNSLYQAMEVVTGTDLRERPRGFAMCLEDVLVKVSGDPGLRADQRVITIAQHANDYVVAFNYVDPIAGTRPKDDQGTYDRSENLTVSFDPAKIDALLVSLGDSPWHGLRPVLVPVLSVHGRKPPAYLLSTTEPLAAEQRFALERIAAEAGIPLRLPATSELINSVSVMILLPTWHLVALTERSSYWAASTGARQRLVGSAPGTLAGKVSSASGVSTVAATIWHSQISFKVQCCLPPAAARRTCCT